MFVGRFVSPELVLKELIFPIPKVSLENNKKKDEEPKSLIFSSIFLIY